MNSFRLNISTVVLLLLAQTVGLTSCNKFLDSKAPQQLGQTQQFSSEQGFQDALTGVYLQMGTSCLYGKEMTYGMLSVASRSYDTTVNPAAGAAYYQTALYNLSDPSVAAVTKNIWDSAYLCIAQLNNMLAQIDAAQALFKNNDYYNMKAEAVALRAFLHFDLLRLFGPASVSQNISVQSIPYVKQFSPYAQASLPAGAFLDSCLSDLNVALLTFKDSAQTSGKMNYWSVKALLARVYMYKGDFANAQAYAQQLIGNNRFTLSTSNADALFSSEYLFSIYIYRNNLVNIYLKSVFSGATPMGLLPANQTALYISGSGSANDWRKAGAFYDPASGQTFNLNNANAVIQPRKFTNTTSVATSLASNNNMPLIRMTEMYYIAAECAQQLNGNYTQATALLDTVRVHRNVPVYTQSALPKDSLTTEISKEYMKEMLGEGQVFYYFKRNNTAFARLPITKVQPAANATYVFQKPE